MRDHKKLRAFELADETAIMIYEMTKTFPQHETYGLISQISRRLDYLDEQKFSTCEKRLTEAEKVLGALIRKLRIKSKKPKITA